MLDGSKDAKGAQKNVHPRQPVHRIESGETLPTNKKVKGNMEGHD